SSTILYHFFFFYHSDANRDLHSFPTRRSSDLSKSCWCIATNAHRTRILANTTAWGASCTPAKTWSPACAGRFARKRTWSAGKWSDRKSTRLNSSHDQISYAVFCLKKKKKKSKE